MGHNRLKASACAAAMMLAGMLMGACGGSAEGDRPPAEAQGSIRSVAAAIAPCVEDPETAMAGVAVTQSEEDPGTMIVTLSDGAAFVVSDNSSEPQPANGEAAALLAACP